MNYAEYVRADEAIAAYLQGVRDRAAAWISLNTGFTVDNTLGDLDAYSVVLPVSVRVSEGQGTFRVFLTHNADESRTEAVAVPASLLDA